MDETKSSRRTILNAAREGFATKGFYGTSMDFIVKRAELSKGAIYWHFPGKWEMYKAVLSEEVERIKRIVIPMDLNLMPSDARDFFITRGDSLIDFLADDPLCRLLLVHLTLEAMRGRDDMADFVSSLRSSITDDLVSVFEVFFPVDSLKRNNISYREIANMFVSILYGLIMNLELTMSREEAKRSWRFLSLSILGAVSHGAYIFVTNTTDRTFHDGNYAWTVCLG